MRAHNLLLVSPGLSHANQASVNTFVITSCWEGRTGPARTHRGRRRRAEGSALVKKLPRLWRVAVQLETLSSDYLENDLVAIQRPQQPTTPASRARLCAVRQDGSVAPLCRRSDDVETDLYQDPREFANRYWSDPPDDHVLKTYGEGYYGQRPVPSLGGGPGYGALADDVWSVDERILQAVERDGVELPILDVGIAHGEKARGGSL